MKRQGLGVVGAVVLSGLAGLFPMGRAAAQAQGASSTTFESKPPQGPPATSASAIAPSTVPIEAAKEAPIAQLSSQGKPLGWVAPPISLTIGLRVGLQTDKNGTTVDPLHIRPLIIGEVYKNISLVAHLGYDRTNVIVPDGNGGTKTVVDERMRILDIIATFDIHDLFHVWAGRFLPPVDRATLSGSYAQNAWNVPNTINVYRGIFAGRDEGMAIWGQVGAGQFKYQAGAFTMGQPTKVADLRYIGRLTLNLLDPEPGYYNSSTYFGTKDILAIGIAGEVQRHAQLDDLTTRNVHAGNIDLLAEKRLGTFGTGTLEGAYYYFGKEDGSTSFSILGSFLIGERVGPGMFQPMGRWQRRNLDDGSRLDTTDVGINYIIDGHNARLAIVWQHNCGGEVSSDIGQLGVQMQK